MTQSESKTLEFPPKETSASEAPDGRTPEAKPSGGAAGKRRAPARRRKPPAPDLGKPEHFINRELSWLEFNRRVLEEALDPSNLLLERVKFLSIFSSNLDEFFMIRVSGLRQQLEAGALTAPPDGRTPAKQLSEIYETLEPMLAEAELVESRTIKHYDLVA